ncbi:hypothetical protein [Nitrolancea hollandica]|uniref:Uncharacterized protein n=1 Tax=Nitrolancea hollandica Lb TaxID=1129897 RepID=I4ELJ8_9BACT|nr:hypothetical protein [Nitrolancea hollandica]CCF85560.1 hypothetical protein NITHO_5160004 [Nitrolancea hollandica Lb]
MLDRNAVAEAMTTLAVDLAFELDYVSYHPDLDDSAPSVEDIAHALREPVSMAAVMADLCRLLGMEPPRVVKLALDTKGVLAP